MILIDCDSQFFDSIQLIGTINITHYFNLYIFILFLFKQKYKKLKQIKESIKNNTNKEMLLLTNISYIVQCGLLQLLENKINKYSLPKVAILFFQKIVICKYCHKWNYVNYYNCLLKDIYKK